MVLQNGPRQTPHHLAQKQLTDLTFFSTFSQNAHVQVWEQLGNHLPSYLGHRTALKSPSTE
jgi:hypothetical protein